MKTLTLKISETLEGDLASFAAERGLSKSEVARQALTRFFRIEATHDQDSALSMVEDLVGTVEGPADLASNPAYLEGFGR